MRSKGTGGAAYRKALAVVAAFAVVGVAAGCSGSTGSEPGADGQVHQLGHVLAPDTDDGRCWEEFVVEVSENSDLNLQTSPSGALGNEPDIYSNLAAGTFKFAGLSTLQLGAAFEKLNVLAFPFIFDDHDHAEAAFNSPEVQELLQEFSDETGVTVLGACSSVFRDLVTSEPVRTPDDLRGMALRVPPSEVSLAMWQAVGGTPREVPHSEVYQALQSGLVHGADYPFGSILSGKYYEATPYFSQTGHSWMAQTMVVNTEFFESLDSETQDVLRQAAQAQTDKVFGIAKESLAGVTAELAKNGTVVEDIDVEAFREATRPVVDELAPKYGVAELYDQLRAYGQ